MTRRTGCGGGGCGAGRRVAAVVLLVLVLATAGAGCSQDARRAPPKTSGGVLDLRDWDFTRDGVVPLDGEWDLVWGRFEDPSVEGESRAASAVAATVPGAWNDVAVDGRPVGAFGHATYRLVVDCYQAPSLALSLPVQHSALRMYVNGRLIARQGSPAGSADVAQPAAVAQIAPLDASLTCPLRFVAHVSNFDLRRGGLARSMELGTRTELHARREHAVIRDAVSLGALSVLAIVPLLFYLSRRRDRTPLFFGLFSLSFALGLSMGGTRLIAPLVAPWGWNPYFKLVFMSWCTSTPLFLLFLRSLYPRHVGTWPLRLFVGASVATAAVVAVTPTSVFTHLIPVFQTTVLLGAGYAALALVRAMRDGHRNAVWLLGGLLTLAAAVFHDTLRLDRLQSESLSPYAMLLFVVVPGVLLARRLSRALSAEEVLALEQREKADLLVRATRAGLFDWDTTSGRFSYSGRLREMLGLPEGAEVREPFYDRVHPDEREQVRARFEAQLRDRSVRSGVHALQPTECRLRREDGRYLWVQVEGIGLCGDDGRTLRFICSFVDVTRLREQEEALRASRDQIAAQAAVLESQNEALKENVRLREEVERIGRHDLKTPLNSILTVPRLLREERELGPEADELLGIVERAGYRILSMVNLSLDLYKMEQGGYVFRPDAVDLSDLVDKVMADVRLHASSKQVRLDLRDEGAPYAWAEELLCYSLLGNLLKNAVEASPEGEVVSVSIAPAGDGRVQVRIHNAGAVPEAMRNDFFRKYATMGKSGGTGLGTYSARLMARVQEGDVTMRTSEGAGTELTVTLRAAAGQVVLPSRRHATQQATTPRAQPLPDLAGMRVLLVDDDEYNLLIVRRFLPPALQVETAVNGRVAIERARQHWPDLVLMDLDMPVMGGLEAVARLRAHEAASGARRCRMIALSSHDDEGTIGRALAAGFDRYLVKPVGREAIEDVLREWHGDVDAALVVVDDPDIGPLLPEFLASREALLDALAAAVTAADRTEVRRVAHQLAGSFGLYGFGWASDRARWLEQNAGTAAIDPMQAEVAALRRHLSNARRALDAARPSAA